jgi:hypothetical protein
MGVWVINRLGLVHFMACRESSMLSILFSILLQISGSFRGGRWRGQDVVATQVEGSEYVYGNLAVEPKTLESNRCDLLPVLIQGADL